jgi:acetyl esterase
MEYGESSWRWADLAATSVAVGGEPSCSKAPPVVLYLRGAVVNGGGDLRHDAIASCLISAGAMVLCPIFSRRDMVFPTILERAYEILTTVHNHRSNFGGRRSKVIVTGKGAGGNLAAGLALMARDRSSRLLDGQALVSPLLNPMMCTASFREAAAFDREHMSECWHHYLGGLHHPYGAPSLCSRLTGLPRAAIVTADNDPMRDESIDYAARMVKAGVEVQQHIFPTNKEWAALDVNSPSFRETSQSGLCLVFQDLFKA